MRGTYRKEGGISRVVSKGEGERLIRDGRCEMRKGWESRKWRKGVKRVE